MITNIRQVTIEDYKRISNKQENYYPEVVDRLVRQKYSMSAELAILRQRDSKPDEFEIYNAYVEECKVQAKQLLNIK